MEVLSNDSYSVLRAVMEVHISVPEASKYVGLHPPGSVTP